MWSSKLFWKLFFVYVGLNLTLTVAFLFVVTSAQRVEINRQVEQRLQDTAIVLRSHVADLIFDVLQERSVNTAPMDPEAGSAMGPEQAELQRIVTSLSAEMKMRLSIVDQDGVVLSDSERNPSTMMNHANRPELVAASIDGRGTATRQSPTLSTDMFYLALAVTDQKRRALENKFSDTSKTSTSQPPQKAFVRVAVRLDTIDQRVSATRRYLWLLALLFGSIATLLAYAIVGRVIGPLTQLTEHARGLAMGVDEEPMRIRGSDEVGSLSEAFNQMRMELSDRFRQLRENNEQMSTVLGSVQEGIIAVNAKENIVLANDASKQLLAFTTDDEVGRPLLEAVRSRRLRELFQQCLHVGETVRAELESVGETRRDLAVTATRLPGDPIPGVVLVLHDVTELRRWENLRQEFVANVSHELKTPLASIKAYAETLRMGALDDQDNNQRFCRTNRRTSRSTESTDYRHASNRTRGIRRRSV